MLAFCSFGTANAQQEMSRVNSVYDEQHPVIHQSGDLFYSKGLHPGNVGGERDLGDIWRSPKTGTSEWGDPIHLKAISTSGNDVVVGFPSENEMLVYHDGTGRKQGIHRYTFASGNWSYDKMLDMGSFRNNSSHFSGRLNSEGNTIVMTLESFGSYGNEDIYVSFRKADGNWSSPQNLGPTINTYKQEMTPSLSKDGLTLYFSSNGHGTAGGRNIFYAQRLDNTWEKWSNPVPLTEINTPGVELAYVEMEDRAMFTTTQNSEGFGDILLTTKVNITAAEPIEEPVAQLQETPEPQQKATTSEKRDSVVAIKEIPEVPRTPEMEVAKEVEEVVETRVAEPRQAIINDINVLDINTLEEVPYSASIVGESGSKAALEELSVYSDDLDVRISSKGYFPQIFSVQSLQQMTEPIYLTPIVKGTSIVLDEIYFKKGTSDLADETSPSNIQKLAEFLNENPEVKIRLEGHTDNLGDPQLNKELSMNRAGQIRKLLIESGIEFERIRVSGWGGTRPVASNQTEEGRNQNRRVEMVIEE